MLTLTRPGIEEYAESKTQPTNALLTELHKATHEEMDYPQMLTGPIEGSFLRLMVQITGAKSILEIGMFTGYSALSMAEGLPADGTVTTLEINPKCIQFAKKYFDKSEHGKKITVKEGPALESLAALKGPFDLVFIDADKGNYKNYYEAVLPKLKSGGIILIDNVLWSGAVLDPKTEDDKAIDDLNKHVAKDDRVDKVLLTIRDGVYFIRKK
ncbi:MAG: class I SAM-dependent methyltransferase [Cyanobacteria bacterium SZAS-4]|nr:class I SAM-dependent methyltransferase [Cyanobacteria bacterium SZAS-4]